jgi:hypothetical protein
MLIETATRQSFARYVMVGRCLEAALLIERREFEAGTALMITTLDTRTNSGWLGHFTEYLGILAQGIAGLGQIGKALSTVGQALARADRGAERWYVAELLRIKGECEELLLLCLGQIEEALRHVLGLALVALDRALQGQQRPAPSERSKARLSPMIADGGPATVPNGWGAVGLRLCYGQVRRLRFCYDRRC